MFNTTKIALAAITIFGAASAAMANDRDYDSSSLAQIEREAAEARSPTHMGNAGNANAYYALPSAQDPSESHRKGHSR
jgi:hypothetical protein